MRAIAFDYLTGSFILDVIATIPGLIAFKNRDMMKFFPLRIFRNIHIDKISAPIRLLGEVLFRSFSKKRQEDLIYFG